MTQFTQRANAALFATSAACGRALWRANLRRHEQMAASRRATTHGGAATYLAKVWHQGWQASCAVRDALSRPQADRGLGTGWDRGAGETTGPASEGVERHDLGRWHRALARACGGGEVALLAVHLPFFALRMARHAVLAVVTGLAFTLGLGYGVAVSGPLATPRHPARAHAAAA